jgi:hypothetical protein
MPKPGDDRLSCRRAATSDITDDCHHAAIAIDRGIAIASALGPATSSITWLYAGRPIT